MDRTDGYMDLHERERERETLISQHDCRNRLDRSRTQGQDDMGGKG